ncbi:hypothetical protein HMPREF9145_1402 [Segatella salivae F0493]|uniref:Uncharacterized protein n=1 Tax=Segatella salivae F0493 TaxID=1395125 RepID=U2L0S1_9BACT|nr:hypothetical protein HMPREF9145_1402 [Segatella salivae F0493]
MWHFSAMFKLIFYGVSWNEVAVEVLKRNKKEEILQKTL